MDSKEFESIVPYTDEEAVKALRGIAMHPYIFVASKFIFPEKRVTYLSEILKNINSIDEFQDAVMSHAVKWDIDSTMTNFTYSGLENLKAANGKFLLMSNHRDIVVDPALVQYVLLKNNIPMTQICVGSNLLDGGKVVEALLRSNRMIKVIRGISARDLYLSSQMLSRYIRGVITSGESSVWIAQRQGRTKDGYDTTEQGLLKMLDMSGEKSFAENFIELNIIPVSISYEYEPCDARKAREKVLSALGPYVKGKKEDLHSIMVGIKQAKGNVHLEFGKPLTREEIELASEGAKNDRYQSIRHLMDRRIIEGYKLWKTNYIGYDLMTGGNKYADMYTAEDVKVFNNHIDRKLRKIEKTVNRDDVRKMLYQIYGAPVKSKENLTNNTDNQ